MPNEIIPRFMVQHYKSLDAGSHVAAKQLTFNELVDYLDTDVVSSYKYAANLYVIGQMVDSYRENKNVINREALCIDFDDIPQDIDLVAEIKGRIKFSYIIYSTHNHTADKPRLRLVVPLTKGIDKKYYKPAIQTIERALQVAADDKSYTVSQAMARMVRQSETADRVFEYQDTYLLDTNKLIALIQQQQPDRTIKNTQLIKRDDDHWDIAYAGMSAGDGRNSAATSLLGLLLRRYVPLKVAIALLQHWNNGNNEPLSEKELRNIIRSVVKIETNRRGGEVT